MPTFNNVTVQNASCVFPPTDQYWNNVSLLLKFDYGYPVTFYDSSSYNRTVTQAWGINSLAVTPVKFLYTNSGSLAPSSGTNLQVPLTKIGTNLSWTWECWFYRDRTDSYAGLFYDSNSLTSIQLDTSNYKVFIWWNIYRIYSVSSIPLNTWTYIAFSYEAIPGSPILRIFINGNLETEQAGGVTPNSLNVTSTFNIGRATNAGFAGMPGYTDEMRFTAGVCRYTTSFTPPTEPFPIGG